MLGPCVGVRTRSERTEDPRPLRTTVLRAKDRMADPDQKSPDGCFTEAVIGQIRPKLQKRATAR